jgi:nucleoside 2-deoxyribosyltransferase
VLTPQKVVDKVLAMPYGMKRKRAFKALNKVLARTNARAIKKCDILIAAFDGVDVDSGTAGEVSFAEREGKAVVAYRGDFRLAADNEGSIVNLQVEYFATRKFPKIALSLKALERYLKQAKKKLERKASR